VNGTGRRQATIEISDSVEWLQSFPTKTDTTGKTDSVQVTPVRGSNSIEISHVSYRYSINASTTNARAR
jgi:hypothetical protein